MSKEQTVAVPVSVLIYVIHDLEDAATGSVAKANLRSAATVLRALANKSGIKVPARAQ